MTHKSADSPRRTPAADAWKKQNDVEEAIDLAREFPDRPWEDFVPDVARRITPWVLNEPSGDGPHSGKVENRRSLSPPDY